MAGIRISQKTLRERAEAVLRGLGVPAADAACTVDCLLDAEISGVQSHGLMRLGAYADRLAQGMIAPNPQIAVQINGAVAHVDGGNGLGQVVADKAAAQCVALAKQYGIGAVTVCNSNHFGTAAYYANRMAQQGCIGFVASLAGPTMAPHGSTALLLGTNPFAVAFGGSQQTFCADMASSAVAKGKIRICAQKGEPIPQGWALDAQGNDTTDPAEAIRGILLPMAGHKGYGLAMAVDALCGLLSGASLSCESASMFHTQQPANTGHFMAALNIAHFLPLEEFAQRAQQWFDRLHAAPTRPGVEQVLIPGEPEAIRRRTAQESIHVSEETAAQLAQYYQKYAEKAAR